MERSRTVLHKFDTMAVRIGHCEIDIAITPLIDFGGNANPFRLQIDAKRFEVGGLQRNVRQAILLLRREIRKNLDILALIDFEIAERNLTVFLEDLEWLIEAEQFSIKLACLF